MRKLGLILAAILVFSCAASCKPLRIHHIDVGQGDCTLIICPDNKTTVLIDAGDDGCGKRFVLPYLRKVGVSHLSYVFVSHYDSDHIGGMDEVIGGIGLKRVGKVYDRGDKPSPHGTSAVQSYKKAANGHRRTLKVGQVTDLGGGASIKCVAENGVVLGHGAVPKATGDENNLSVAWVLTYKHFRYFTAGDCAGQNSSPYVDMETPLASVVGRVDAMKIDHHGSATSVNTTLVGTLSATAAIIEVGTSTHNHPTQEALNRLRGHSVVYATEKGNGGTLPSGCEYVANETGKPTNPIRSVLLTTDGTSTFTVHCGPCITHCYPLH